MTSLSLLRVPTMILNLHQLIQAIGKVTTLHQLIISTAVTLVPIPATYAARR